MLKPFLILAVLVFLEFSALGQQGQTSQPPAQYTIPAEAVQKANPTKPMPESIAKGKKLYGYDCVMCHGANGDGKGELAKDLTPPVSDFRDPAVLKARTDGELFYLEIISSRISVCPEGQVKLYLTKRLVTVILLYSCQSLLPVPS